MPQTPPRTAAGRIAGAAAAALIVIATLTGCSSGSGHNAGADSPGSATNPPAGSTTPPPSSTPPATTSSVTLSWSKPTQNVDGTALTDLAGYKIYYGQEPASLKSIVEVRGASITSAIVEKLEPGRWHFALSAYTSDGVESVQTGVVSTVVGGAG